MKLQNLINFEQLGKIKKESFALNNIESRYNIVSNRIKTAEKLLKNNNDDEGVYISAYSELYSSFRNLCEIMLALCGYRVNQGKGHHESAIATLPLTLDDDKIKPTYLRLKKIGGKRNDMEYGGKFDISSFEMETMLEDVQLVLQRVRIEIDKKNSENNVSRT